jgi:3',5'-cyclic AMP phosphodiesterase CpdA
MKTITFGDIHGRDCWKNIIFGGDLEFQNWCEDPTDLDYEKIIFIGDYVDSYDIMAPDIFLNLKDILKFKITAPDKVVLLFGNHDWQYIANQMYSGFTFEMSFDYKTFFLENLHHFNLAYYQKVGDRDVIWVHAGITITWIEEFFVDYKERLDRVGLTLNEENRNDPEFIVECLNFALQTLCRKLNDVGYESGGSHGTGGPIWARIKSLYRDPLPNITQIVGHTHMRDILHFEAWNKANIIMVDCLEFESGKNTEKNCLVIDGEFPEIKEVPTRLIFNR